MTDSPAQPWRSLSRHFFASLFHFGILSEVGAESFKRMMLGICVAFLSFGLLLLRIFMKKYAVLNGLDSAEPYRVAVLADLTQLIALPMWIAAFAAVLLGHALFPDATDFRVLTPMPLSRAAVFAAKLWALARFASLLIVSAHIALTPLFLLMAASRWAADGLFAQALAFFFASGAAALCALLAIVAIQGVLLLAAPRDRLLAVSAAARSVMACALVLMLPALLRLTGQSQALAEGHQWLVLAPPVWFLGLDQWLLGERTTLISDLGAIAVVAFTVAGGSAAVVYAVLYRHFDRVMMRAGGDGPSSPPWMRRLRSSFRSDRPFAAIRRFVMVTFRRSGLHQGILVVLSALGAGLAANSLIGSSLAGRLLSGSEPGTRLIEAVLWAPVVLIYATSLAARQAMAVPLEPHANWIFRMTEHEALRQSIVGGATRAVFVVGTLVPLLLFGPVQAVVLGSKAVAPLTVTALYGWLFAEVTMRHWGSAPFCSSYLPGKRFVPQMIVSGVASFVIVTSVGTTLARLAMRSLFWAILAAGVLSVTAAVLGRTRRARSRATPLEFDDRLPSQIETLRLSAD